MDETRALLDALMGPNRNQTHAAVSSGMPEFADKSICKNFLVGFCPHDWFSMPKRQLMPCSKIHSELMKEKFETHPEVAKYRAFYEEDFLTYLQPVARDCDNYIVRERAKCRPKMATGKPRMPPDVQLKFDDLSRRYSDLVKQSEDAADAASLALSKELMGQALVLQEDIDTLKAKYTTEFQGEDICEVCGVRYPLGAGGAEWHDKESHKRGKTHQGFSQIRAKIDELISKRRDWDKYRSQRRSEYEPMLQKEREQEKPPAREREDRRERDRPREKDRDEKDRSRGRARPKEPDRKDRHGDRDRKRGRSLSSDRSRSRRRKEASSRAGQRREPPSPPPAAKEREPSSDRSRGRREKEKEKEKDKDKKAAKGDEPPKRPPSPGRRSPDYSQDAPAPSRPAEPSKKAEESEEEAPVPEDEKDGITVLEEDLPEFWARIQKLKGNVRNEAVAALSTATKERLEKWLVSRLRKRIVASPAVAKVGA